MLSGHFIQFFFFFFLEGDGKTLKGKLGEYICNK